MQRKINKHPKTIGEWMTYQEYLAFKRLGLTKEQIQKHITFYEG